MTITPSIPWLADVPASLQSLPLGTHLPVLVALVAGAVLWSVGSRVLKPIAVLLGAAVGGLMGFLAAPAFFTGQIMNLPAPYAGLAGGAIVGALVAYAAFRLLVGGGMALSFAAAAGLGTLVALHGAPESARTLHEGLTPPTLSELRSAVVPAGGDLAAEGDSDSERTRAFVEAARTRISETWTSIPPDVRASSTLAAIAGGFVGLLVGVLAPRKSCALMTSLVGSGVLLLCGAWLAHAFAPDAAARFNPSTQVWLGVWGGLTAIGLISQVRRHKEPAAPVRERPDGHACACEPAAKRPI